MLPGKNTVFGAGNAYSARCKLLVVSLSMALYGTSLLPGLAIAAEASEEEFYFYSDLAVGALNKQNLAKVDNLELIAPGNYTVDIYINDNYFRTESVNFSKPTRGPLTPCLDDALLIALGIKPSEIALAGQSCSPLGKRVPDATSQFDLSSLRLNILVPQAKMVQVARGEVDPQSLDAGESILFTNYNAVAYRSEFLGQTSDSGYLGLNSGVNIGLWRLYNVANFQYNNSGTTRTTHFDSTRTYAKRALIALNSELTVGQSSTSGNLFGSLPFKGVQLASDERMLPQSRRGYAPEIRGTANTMAKVTVKQYGNIIYQETVSPGPFVINDLYPTNYEGDMTVEVTEADGRVSSFVVPFAAVPESVRPGSYKYNVSTGVVDSVSFSSSDPFADATLQYGLSNAITANSGLRVAEGYQALLMGGVWSGTLGALGSDFIWSRAAVGDDTQDGWRTGLSYSKNYLATGTNLTLTTWRYSTTGFRDLYDALGERYANRHGEVWNSFNYQQQNQFVININQTLGNYGAMYVSGSLTQYRHKPNDKQLQLGYTNTLGRINYNLNYSRQYSGRDGMENSGFEGWQGQRSATQQDTFTLSFSFPLGRDHGQYTPGVTNSLGITRGNDGTRSRDLNTTLYGLAPAQVGYSLGYSRRDGQDHTSANDWNASLNKRFSAVSASVSASRGAGYNQYSGTAIGGIVAHSGGVLFAPHLGETFGLIEAKGAEGATVQNAPDSVVNSRGYAVIPQLTPYTYNQVGLNVEDADVELLDSQKLVAPYAGAAVKVEIKTLSGDVLFARVVQRDGTPVPFGAQITDARGKSYGTINQGGQIYLRASANPGELTLRWGEEKPMVCRVDGLKQQSQKPLVRQELQCQ